MNDHLEAELKRALARVEPPEGFAERVIETVRTRNTRRFPAAWMLAIAACLALAVVFAGYQRSRLESRRKSEQQLVFALQLTSQKLSVLNERLKKASVHISIQENL